MKCCRSIKSIVALAHRQLQLPQSRPVIIKDALSSNVFLPASINWQPTNSQQKVDLRYNETQTAAFTSFSAVT